MNVDILNQFMLSLFFIYLLLISADISDLLNCDTQKFIKNNPIVKHVIIFATIYILTFILNWYTPDKIVVEKDETKEPFQVFPEKYSYLTQSFTYSIIIYIVFLVSSKMAPLYFIVFICFIIAIFIMFLMFKVNTNELGIENIELNTLFMYTSGVMDNIKDTDESIDLKENEISNILYLYNSLVVSYLVLPIIMVVGVYQNYKKRRADKKDLTLLNFFFEKKPCKNL